MVWYSGPALDRSSVVQTEIVFRTQLLHILGHTAANKMGIKLHLHIIRNLGATYIWW